MEETSIIHSTKVEINNIAGVPYLVFSKEQNGIPNLQQKKMPLEEGKGRNKQTKNVWKGVVGRTKSAVTESRNIRQYVWGSANLDQAEALSRP